MNKIQIDADLLTRLVGHVNSLMPEVEHMLGQSDHFDERFSRMQGDVYMAQKTIQDHAMTPPESDHINERDPEAHAATAAFTDKERALFDVLNRGG